MQSTELKDFFQRKEADLRSKIEQLTKIKEELLRTIEETAVEIKALETELGALKKDKEKLEA